MTIYNHTYNFAKTALSSGAFDDMILGRGLYNAPQKIAVIKMIREMYFVFNSENVSHNGALKAVKDAVDERYELINTKVICGSCVNKCERLFHLTFHVKYTHMSHKCDLCGEVYSYDLTGWTVTGGDVR